MGYIDDLLTLNNGGFDDTINDIYPPELELKKTTDCPTTLSYLDIRIAIANRKYFTTVLISGIVLISQLVEFVAVFYSLRIDTIS